MTATTAERIGPHPSYIELARPYILHSRILSSLAHISSSSSQDAPLLLQGIAYIDSVRRALSLPIRTYNTAAIYYHKFRLLHAEQAYSCTDAAAAALFTACKIEDTLKKSREILAGWWNLKAGGVGELVSPDDARFESHSKLILGLERLMLESASFDFRNRYPQKLMVKLLRALKMDQHREARTAWNLSIDLYRTFAPLKQTTPTLALACVELAVRLHGLDAQRVVDTGVTSYVRWNTSRMEVMETLLDLLDLYTHHQRSTSVGPLYPLETFLNIRISLNNEAAAAELPRHTTYASEPIPSSSSTTSPTSPTNGHTQKAKNGLLDPTSPLTPATPGTMPMSPSGMMSTGNGGSQPTSAIGVRGQNGTVRFMLDARRAREEGECVDRFWRAESEEVEVEVEDDDAIVGGEDRQKEARRERDGERKDKDRDRDAARDKDREKDRDRERERGKDNEKMRPR